MQLQQHCTLQRGRARAGAEILNALPGAEVMICFNGAAPARARKSGLWLRSIARASTLQRGRARAGAEIRWSFPMCLLIQLLQRGRARAGAEMSPNEECQPRQSGFNGAAPARARKSNLGSSIARLFPRFNGAAPARARKYICVCTTGRNR